MQEMIFAGFGGQGVLLAGQLLTYAGMIAGRQISWIPAYGPEMRGGTASCSVIISDNLIGSPIVTKPNVLIAFNQPSLDRFVGDVKSGGIVIVNSSLCDKKVEREDVQVYYVPMNAMATEMGNDRALNMIALGTAVGATAVVQVEAVQAAFMKKFGHKPGVVESNMQAVVRGIQAVGGSIPAMDRQVVNS